LISTSYDDSEIKCAAPCETIHIQMAAVQTRIEKERGIAFD